MAEESRSEAPRVPHASHLEKFLSLLDEMGMTGRYGIARRGGTCRVGMQEFQPPTNDETWVLVGQGEGFTGFFASFEFDADGRFLRHGVYE